MLKQIAIAVLILGVVINFGLYIFKNDDKAESESLIPNNKLKVFTPVQLKQMSNQKTLYLAILGNVYDVTKGAKHYQEGGSYSFFTGVDGSRAFITGEFKNDLNDKVDDLQDAQIADLFNWKKFFDETYTHVGYVTGRFYDANGEKTEYLSNLDKVLEKQKHVEQLNSKFMSRFPTCNSEWTQEKGLVKVWCTTESGGIKRSWMGYPRLVYNPNSKTEGCACVNDEDLSHPSVKKYPNCDEKAHTCHPTK